MTGADVKLSPAAESVIMAGAGAGFNGRRPDRRARRPIGGQGEWVKRMGQALVAILGLALLAAVGGALYVAIGDIAPPTERIEKTLPDARFDR